MEGFFSRDEEQAEELPPVAVRRGEGLEFAPMRVKWRSDSSLEIQPEDGGIKFDVWDGSEGGYITLQRAQISELWSALGEWLINGKLYREEES